MLFFKRFKKFYVPPGTGLVKDPRPKKERDLDYLAEEVLTAEAVKWETKQPKDWRKFPIFNQDGSGSCFHYNTPILMENFSYRPIGEIREGDYVITHLGNVKKVIKKFKRKWQGNTLKIQIYGMYREIECSLEHPFLTLNGWKEAKDLTKNDYIAIPYLDNIVADKTIYQIEKNPDFLWLLGVYLAEGYLGDYQITLSIGRHEEIFKKKIINTLKRLNFNFHIKENLSKPTSTNIVFGNKELRKLFLELGNEKCDKKRINKRLMFLNPELQFKIYEGWKEGDGHRREKRNIGVSTSEELIWQMYHILLRNKIRSSILKRKKEKNKLPVWDLVVYPEENKTNRYTLERKDYLFRKIRKITKVPEYSGGHLYNLEIEDDNSYIVNSIAVHNCVAQTIAKLLGIENFVEEGKFVHYSARDIYSRRTNYGSKGMWLQNGLHIGYKYGATFEQLMPSQGLNEEEMNKFDDRKTIDEQVALVGKAGNYVQSKEIDFDAIATVISQGKGVALACRFNPGDWKKGEVVNRKDGKYGHLVAGVDYCLWKGKKAIIFDNSWDYKWGFDGQGIITEDQPIRAWGYFQFLKNTWRDEIDKEKPKHKFEKDLSYGMRNYEVAMLQECLKYEELFPVNVPSTGYYGRITAKAVYEFQIKYQVAPLEEIELLQGKKVGPKTRKKLNYIFK
ncbi:MAG: C1 family peptidase [Candidatus Hodarchaeales archaeon]